MPKKLFGTDGVRGVANQEPMTAETVMKLGRAIARLSAHQNPGRRSILVGRDTRLSGNFLEMALSAGICSIGADTVLVGAIPSPAIAFLTKDRGCDAGAVISASHNPFEDNGIKFFAGDGFKLSDEREEHLESLMDESNLEAQLPTHERVGKTINMTDAVRRYATFVKKSIPDNMSLKGMKVVLDCANGAACEAGPLIFEELGAQVKALNTGPDGCNINLNCGSLHPKVVCDEVRKSSADIGIALDGDADRVIFADEKGNEVDGDKIMGLIAADLFEKGLLAGNTLVATVMSNMGLEFAMNDLGVNLIRTPVGDRYVVDRMRKDGYNFGGEQSGHLIFLDHSTSGDGILSALQVIRVMQETSKPLSELASRVKRFPQILKNVTVRQQRNLAEIPEVARVIADSEQSLQHRGRLLVRYSGTQLLCRVMAEGENETEIRRIVEKVADAIARNV